MLTTARPLGCHFIASSFYQVHRSNAIVTTSIIQSGVRQYAAQSSPSRKNKAGASALPQPDPVRSALTVTEADAKNDPINPPRSTLPPDLSLPTRGSETVFVYYFNIGRAYGGFYKNGIKAVWYNYKAAKLLKERITQKDGAKDISDAVEKGLLSRSEFQMLARNSHDIGKLPFFGLLVLIFGEWLPLLVPFMPNAVPGTCRIPKQIRGMTEKAEERRRISFRSGITEPSIDQLPSQSSGATTGGDGSWSIAFNRDYRTQILNNLQDHQLLHLSSSLGLHSRLWDRIQLPPPSVLLRRNISRRLEYLTQDDALLLKHEEPQSSLSEDELHIACSERGLDVLGRPEAKLREHLAWWLKRQTEDAGRGRALLAMLFRRPNVWEDIESGPLGSSKVGSNAMK